MSNDTARKSGATYYGDMPCRNCAYWRTLGNYKNLKLWACHYALVNRHSRGCEPGEGCTKKNRKLPQTDSFQARWKHQGDYKSMTAKEWLMRGRALEKTITALQEARKRAYARATGATAPVRDTPGGKGSTGNKADPYIELGEKIAEKENELAEIYGEIVRVLGEMRDNELQTLLLERYVNGATWAQTARRLHYSEAHVKGYMHRMALNAVDKLIPHNTQ